MRIKPKRPKKPRKPSKPGKSRRYAIVVAEEISPWGSCRVITPGLVAAYKGLHSVETKLFRQPLTPTPARDLAVAREIARFKPDRVIFLDHRPHPYPLLVPLTQLLGHEVPFVFHLYGDFTLYTREWLKCAPWLARRRAFFVTASPRQRGLLRGVVKSATNLGVIPFPVDGKSFAFVPKLRAKGASAIRRPGQVTAVYTGRVSLQKNVRILLDLFADELRERRMHLVIAGEFDDIGMPFFGIPQGSHEEYTRFVMRQRQLEIPDSQVSLLGDVPRKKVLELLHAADFFVSLSTYHDEDFGMSPIEALCVGTPCLLSDWGGFQGFQLGSALDPRFMRVRMSAGGPEFLGRPPGATDIEKWRSESDSLRSKRSALFRGNFSVEAVSERIRKLHAKEIPVFQGFSRLLAEHARAYDFHQAQKKPLFEPYSVGKKGSLYFRFYSPYFK